MVWSSGRTLSTSEWVAFQDSQIRARGLSPLLRVCYTGHSTFIRPQYLLSIGKWGALETSDMVSSAAPHLAMLHVSPSALRQFKTRFGLMTKSQFERHHGPQPWRRAKLSFQAHARAQRAFGLANGMEHRIVAPIGTACDYAVKTARARLGLLAVEVVLWSSILDQLLGLHGLCFEDWEEFSDADKLMVWELGRDGAPWDFDQAAREPSLLRVEGQRFQAAE